MANPSPQHNPTDGLGTATQVFLSGTGVTALVAGQLYKVALNVSGSPAPTTVALTGALKDVGANAFSSGNSNTVTFVSLNTYVATVSGGTVTAVRAGQAVIEARFPTFDVDATKDANDYVSVQILVNVGP